MERTAAEEEGREERLAAHVCVCVCACVRAEHTTSLAAGVVLKGKGERGRKSRSATPCGPLWSRLVWSGMVGCLRRVREAG